MVFRVFRNLFKGFPATSQWWFMLNVTITSLKLNAQVTNVIWFIVHLDSIVYNKAKSSCHYHVCFVCFFLKLSELYTKKSLTVTQWSAITLFFPYQGKHRPTYSLHNCVWDDAHSSDVVSLSIYVDKFTPSQTGVLTPQIIAEKPLRNSSPSSRYILRVQDSTIRTPCTLPHKPVSFPHFEQCRRWDRDLKENDKFAASARTLHPVVNIASLFLVTQMAEIRQLT